MSWRDAMAPMVAEVIGLGLALKPWATRDELRKFSNERFPFGEREYHPYEIWKSEVKRQLGLIRVDVPRPVGDAPGQRVLFAGRDHDERSGN